MSAIPKMFNCKTRFLDNKKNVLLFDKNISPKSIAGINWHQNSIKTILFRTLIINSTNSSHKFLFFWLHILQYFLQSNLNAIVFEFLTKYLVWKRKRNLHHSIYNEKVWVAWKPSNIQLIRKNKHLDVLS